MKTNLSSHNPHYLNCLKKRTKHKMHCHLKHLKHKKLLFFKNPIPLPLPAEKPEIEEEALSETLLLENEKPILFTKRFGHQDPISKTTKPFVTSEITLDLLPQNGDNVLISPTSH